MSVLRSRVLLVLAVLLLPTLAGCGGAAVPGASASAATGAGATPPVASQPAGGDDGTTVSNPPLVPATYTTGTFHVEVTGDVNKTLDVPLHASGSFSAEGTTILSYADANGGVGSIILSPDVNGFTVSSPEISVGGSNGDTNVCAVVVTQSDAARVAGTFDCRGIVGLATNGGVQKTATVDVRGTFEASR